MKKMLRISVAMLVTVMLVGCGDAASTTTMDPSPTQPMDAPLVDTRPAPTRQLDVPPTAGVPVQLPTIGTALRVRFDGPATQRIAMGTTGAYLYRFALRAERNLQVRLPAFTLASLVSSSGHLGCLVDGDGTPNFTNLRATNMDDGATLSGPTSLWPTAGSYRQTLGLSDVVQMRQGDEISIAVRGDVPRTESSCPVVGQSYAITAGREGRFFSPGDVRILDENRDALPQEIDGNVEIPGNPFTITRSELRIGLGSAVSSSTIVKRQANVRSVAITLTANDSSDLLVRDLPLLGVGDIGAGIRRFDFDSVVTSCTLHEGDVQIGEAQAPDSTGVLGYRNINYVVARGTTRTLVVQCTADSVVSQRRGDRYAIGLLNAEDIDVVDTDGIPAYVIIDDLLERQLRNPVTEITVVNSGLLAVGNDMIPSAERIVTGGNPWFRVANYWAQASIESQVVDRAAVTWGDQATSECVYQVGIFYEGTLRGQARVYPGMTRVDVDLSASPLSITSTTGLVQVMARFEMPRNGTRCDVGSQHQFGLGVGITTGEWDSNYSTSTNLRTTGTISGERIYTTRQVELGGPVTLVSPGI